MWSTESIRLRKQNKSRKIISINSAALLMIYVHVERTVKYYTVKNII